MTKAAAPPASPALPPKCSARPYFAPGYVLADARTVANMLRYLVQRDSVIQTNTTPITNNVVRA